MRRFPAHLAFSLLLCCLSFGAEEKKTPLTAARALKLGLDGVFGECDPSEAGQDQAARLYATAKRLETENALGQKNLELVLTLDEWRDVLTKCRRESFALAYIVNGGGTMYSHGSARDCAAVEDFLAGLSKDLPLADGKGSAAAEAKIADAIAFLKTLKPYDSGDAADDKEARASLTDERARAIEQWENLKYAISDLPARKADQIVAFAEDSLGWLKEP
jgi:hypothetical protein